MYCYGYNVLFFEMRLMIIRVNICLYRFYLSVNKLFFII